MASDEQLVKAFLDVVQAQAGNWIDFQVDEPEEFARLARWIHSAADSPHRQQYGADRRDPRNAFAIEWYDPGEGWGAKNAYREASGGKGRIKYRPPRFRPDKEPS